MKVKRIISIAVAVGSAWLGGSLGATALNQANAAPLASAEPSRTSHVQPVS